MKEIKEKIKFSEKLGFSTFSTALNIIYNFKSIYYLIFLTNVLQIPVGTAGLMLTIGTVWDAINDPLIATFTANHKFKSGEKIRPYALYCCIPWAISIVLLFTDFNAGLSWKVILGILIYFIYEALNTFIGMPYNSMAALATNKDADRKSINAFRSIGGTLGSGIGAVAVTPLVKLFGGLQGEGAIIGPTDAKALFLSACAMGVLCIIGSLIHYFTTEERVQSESNEEVEKISLFQAYKMLFKCKSWVRNMLYVITYGVSNALVMQSINYYAAYILGESSKATPILAAYLVAALLTGVLAPKVDKAIGRKKTMMLGALFLIVGKIPFIISPSNIICVYINSVTVGIGGTIAFVLFNTNRNNIADLLELQNGKRIDALVAGGDNLAAKLAEALTIQAISLGLQFTGFNEELKFFQTEATKNMICSYLGWIPCIIALLMLFFTSRIDVQKEIDEYKN